MVYFLYTLFFISCVALIGSVLLQPGKTDAGALFTSSTSSNAFGPRGTATVLSKVTIAAASIFMLSALLLAMPALTGDISVLSTTTGETTQPANTDANVANTNVDANAANTNAVVDTNTANANVIAPVNNSNTNTAVNANKAANINKASNTNKAANTNAAKNANK